MDARTQYEQDIIRTIYNLARGPHLSDACEDGEIAGQKIFFPALQQFIAACERVRELSPIQADTMSDLLAAIADGAPGETAWNERINEAKRGWDQ